MMDKSGYYATHSVLSPFSKPHVVVSSVAFLTETDGRVKEL